MFRAIDADADGRVTPEEMRAFFMQGPQGDTTGSSTTGGAAEHDTTGGTTGGGMDAGGTTGGGTGGGATGGTMGGGG
jgi:hypothetical protein